jgi:hypothetical protein
VCRSQALESTVPAVPSDFVVDRTTFAELLVHRAANWRSMIPYMNRRPAHVDGP